MSNTNNTQGMHQQASVAVVTYSESGNYGAMGELEHRNAPVFSAGGISWCSRAKAMIWRWNFDSTQLWNPTV